MISRVVAVAGPKGSTGCSFVTAGLGLCLAAAGLATLILDADSESPGLAAILGCGSPAGGSEAIELGRNLRLVEAGAGADGRELTAAARTSFQSAVIDLGHHPGQLQMQIAIAVDWLLWVVTSDRIGLVRADSLLGKPGLIAGSGGLLFNRRTRLSSRASETALAVRHQLPVMGLFDERTALRGRPLIDRPPHRDRTLGRPFRELARTLHPQASAAGPAWP